MEPVTHFLTGACIGRAGLNRKTAYGTLAAVLAAEAADLDVLWSLNGPVESLKHHRGITHTLVGAPVVAGATVGFIWLLHRWLIARRKRRLEAAQAADRADNPDAPVRMLRAPQPVSWRWLYLSALIAALSHLALDWTNNYGVRPFFPFNPRWYAGSFVFIAEPLLWAVFLLALFVPWLLGLADREMGARRTPFPGRGWAIFALGAMVALWGWRWVEHARALALAEGADLTAIPVKRMAMEPYPVNPFRWHALIETADFYQTAEVDTRKGSVDSDPETDVLFKTPSTPSIEAAKQTALGRVYLDWGAWAIVQDLGKEPIPNLEAPNLPAGRAWATVRFDDLRFQYSYLGRGRTDAPRGLTGWVYIVDGHEDAGESIGGREQR